MTAWYYDVHPEGLVTSVRSADPLLVAGSVYYVRVHLVPGILKYYEVYTVLSSVLCVLFHIRYQVPGIYTS